ncbi:transcription factor HHO5 [Fagus crenata]
MELTLDLSSVFVPKTIAEFLGEISTTKNSSEKLSKLDDCVQRLEDEKRKIEAFKRELPLCMLILNDAILRLKEEAMQCMESVRADKKSWMSSVQLWSSNNKADTASEVKLRGEEDDWSGLENPIEAWNSLNMTEEKEVSQVTSLSLMTPLPEFNPSNSISERRSTSGCRVSSSSSSFLTDQSMTRKQRRYWSPELHRSFVNAIQQLGGDQVATPRQIRELMKVDGLTNDEVKSHLQKYRLHIRKLPASSATNGLWMECGEHPKPNTSQSRSPQGTLLAGESAKGLFSVGDDSKETEGDEKSDGRSWKGGLHKRGEECTTIH